jgi:NAD(P)-dependent dehydrogenase (short-subunit alcohol dehydrogenase family)
MACPFRRTELGIERQLATNYVGHAQLTSLLASALTEADGARVVSLSSSGHHFSPIVLQDLNFVERRYQKNIAYGQSKTANALLAVKVSSELGKEGVTALAVHPGMIPTGLMQYVTDEDIKFATEQIGLDTGALNYKTVEAGAATSVWATVAPELSGKGPLYLEDCAVAPIVEVPNYTRGVLRYALDPESADALWSATEKLLQRKLPL